jgi:glycosyltransferase involved in cell wall biosynthesis
LNATHTISKMKKFPRISVVTPSFNQAIYLEYTIESVVSQNYPELEYLVIDGGSTDGSIEIIKKHENEIAYWLSEKDKGMYDAIQKGFEKSSGEIMGWINSDDMYHPKSLFTVAEIFSKFPEVCWLVGAATAFDEEGRTVSVKQSKRFSKYDFYSHDFKWLQQESVFWRRSLWNKAGSALNVNLKYAGDFALWLQFFSHEKLYVTDALIGGFRLRSSDQFTLERINEYLEEINFLLSSLNLSKADKEIISRYKRILLIERLLKRIKIFRSGALEKRYRGKYFQKGKQIVYDRFSSGFILKD